MNEILSGVKVLDLTRFFAGPYCTMLLGDYGAEVIKLESPGGDTQREQGPPFVGDQSLGFMAVNRNKKSIVVDIKKPEGLKIAQDLIREADVVVENFRNGVADRIGLGFEAASELNPSIVYCSMSGYGKAGPEADKPAFDHTIQAFSGFMSMNGLPGGEPVKPAISIVDLITGVYAFAGIQAALLRRERTGGKEPQHVETSLLESIVSCLTDAATGYLYDGSERKALGSHHANLAPYGAFRAKDGFLVIGAGHSHIWRRLCEAMDLAWMITDPRFIDSKDRKKNHGELTEILEGKFGEHTVTELVELFLSLGIPAAPVNSIGQALDSEQIRGLGMVVSLLHPELGEMKLLGPAVKQPGVVVSEWEAPPMLGANTAEILSKLLGYSPEDVERLAADGVIGTGKTHEAARGGAHD